MDTKIRLLIADDHELILDALQSLLAEHPRFDIIGTARDGDLLHELALRYKPDMILTDIKMPIMNGIEATKTILAKQPEIKIVALTMLDNEYAVIEMLEAGAKGYLVKNSSKEEIIDALETVDAGEPYYCQHTTPLLTKLIAKSAFDPYQNRSILMFDEREKAIIRLICKERTNQEIADELFLSVRTIEWYRLNLTKKIGARNIAGVIIYAMKAGIYEV